MAQFKYEHACSESQWMKGIFFWPIASCHLLYIEIHRGEWACIRGADLRSVPFEHAVFVSKLYLRFRSVLAKYYLPLLENHPHHPALPPASISWHTSRVIYLLLIGGMIRHRPPLYRVCPFRLKIFFAYKRNKAKLDPFHMCFTISL
jgi:hypothetical protein